MKATLSEIVIPPSKTILETLECIDNSALRVVLVVDEKHKLLGIVTDGDIRRGILKRLSLDTPISEVMMPNPVTASSSLTRREMLALMQSKNLLTLPLVDDGELVGLATLQSLLAPKKHDNPVFLMAGGFGTRLRPLTDNCPKPLLKVGTRPMLEIILRHFIRYGFHKFYISTHYLPEMIREHFKDGSEWGVSIQYIHEESPLGTGGALGLLPDDIGDLPLIMMNGDILTNMDFEKLLEYHQNHNADATMCVREYQYKVPYGVVEGSAGCIERMVEKPVQYFNVNTGIYVINSDIVSRVQKDQAIGMPTLLEKEIAMGNKVMMYALNEYWLDIGQMEDYKRAQNDIMNLEDLK